MARQRKSAKDAGRKFERDIADYLANRLNDDRIDRRVKRGSNDRGDIGGIRHMGGEVVIECKNYGGRILPAAWLAEAEIERGNADALCGLVVAKRRGKADPGDAVVLMSLHDLAALMSGQRDEE